MNQYSQAPCQPLSEVRDFTKSLQSGRCSRKVGARIFYADSLSINYVSPKALNTIEQHPAINNEAGQED
jgi:hypothetical protein